MMMHKPHNRIWEIDCLRGLAIIFMVFYHFIYDLNEFYGLPVNYEEGFIYFTGKAASTLFILLAGISCSLSKSNFNRGLRLLMIAIILTIITSIAVPGSHIFFGILHFLAISILLYPLFHPLHPIPLLIIGTLILAAGPLINDLALSTNLLLPLGLTKPDFFSVDYFPLIPYLGLFLYGVSLGKWLYNNKTSRFAYVPLAIPFIFLGQHSLFIYLIHQPIFLLLHYLFLDSGNLLL
ncbi:heparan-alpha-glucosaminide N-acetyltransferase [Desulfotomaculum sp. 1211_IL3151]|uniref:heparan-alpha-glucosaminide N-acetyltransferase n=1 Tax=Desulfotomaculum sp. 1211_IL3151 TaxID=3084055 RepID=UPI002FD9ED57